MGNVYVEEIITPLSSFQIYKLFHEEKHSFLLDSAMDPQRLGRYSFFGTDPFITLEAKKDKIIINEFNEEKIVYCNPFFILKELLARYKIINDTDLPFVGGAVGFFSYDLCHHIEKLPQTAIDDINLPDMIIGFYDTVLVFDHLKKTNYIVALNLSEIKKNDALIKAQKIKARIETGGDVSTGHLDLPYRKNKVELISNLTYADYCSTIDRAREYIRCGDIYQMNMTQRFSTLIDRHPINIYAYLRSNNPAPFAAYMNYGAMKILSSSPERFIKLYNGHIETRPIKGTMPRGKGEEDAVNRDILQNSVKDKAENLMIVDLMRNDIGKVCKFGSVKVTELFHIEEYSTVFQMVSTVEGELAEGYDAVDCILNTFPGGSITGAPKIRSMEIIDELEPTCRHIYTGSIGYIGFDGNMDLNIVIRTILIHGQKAYYQVGGGIVWDSAPEKEYNETMDKGLALRRALLNEN
jgi:para-aminobenzoate synthetase component 1